MEESHQSGEVAQLRSQLRELLDRHEISDLTSRLGLWLDEKRFDEASTIFTEDVVAQTPGGVAQGIERMTEQARRNHASYARTQHVITNALVDLDGDRATIRANLIVTFVHQDGAPAPRFTLGEQYRFEAVRTLLGWRFSRVEVNPAWMSGSRDGKAAPQAASSGGQG